MLESSPVCSGDSHKSFEIGWQGEMVWHRETNPYFKYYKNEYFK
jgi:hypothetical protein